MKILALHGFRTSGEIFSMQTGAFRYHLGLDLVCVNAPHPASGPCDPMVQQIYSSYAKYEWFARSDTDKSQAVAMKDASLKYLLDLIAEKGYFEGILGFSQGAAMATVLLEHYRSNDLPCPFKFAIMIAGVEPKIFYPEVS
ncbi:hypothetical protein EON65_15660 [archaeon]|nr:MAG: hypothetical protein EON65_15660 [archaeon]